MAGHAEWIFKEYLAPVPALEARRLNRLIELPGQMKPTDALVSAHTSWPLARYQRPAADRGRAAAAGPRQVQYDLELCQWAQTRKPLDVDVLALNEADQVRRKLPPQRLPDRISVCASIAAVGALFERWNWSTSTGRTPTCSGVRRPLGLRDRPGRLLIRAATADPIAQLGRPAGTARNLCRATLRIGIGWRFSPPAASRGSAQTWPRPKRGSV